MTNQEIFDKVVTHLGKQRARCVSANLVHGEDDTCLYRGPNDMKCAIGCLIPDELYDPEMEGEDACGLLIVEALRSTGCKITTEVLMILLDLQSVHDNFAPKNWPFELLRVADLYSLDGDVIGVSFSS